MKEKLKYWWAAAVALLFIVLGFLHGKKTVAVKTAEKKKDAAQEKSVRAEARAELKRAEVATLEVERRAHLSRARNLEEKGDELRRRREEKLQEISQDLVVDEARLAGTMNAESRRRKAVGS